jgi:hypothetical protein
MNHDPERERGGLIVPGEQAALEEADRCLALAGKYDARSPGDAASFVEASDWAKKYDYLRASIRVTGAEPGTICLATMVSS